MNAPRGVPGGLFGNWLAWAGVGVAFLCIYRYLG
jgi:hypothetical protein